MSKNLLIKQTVLQGAFTLTVAWIIIRVLGAIYRIPLARMLGGEGMAFYTLPNQFYQLFFTLSAAGIPVAMASIISEKITLGHYHDALRTFRVVLTVMLLFGLFFSLLLYVSAGWLTKIGLVAIPEAYLGIQAVAPIIFFAAVTSAYRGLFQGFQNMRIVAYSEVFNQVMLVVATLLFSYLLLPRGLEIAAAGANLGALLGAVSATLMLFFFYRRQRKYIYEMVKHDSSGIREKTLSLLKRISIIALPISFASMAISVNTIINHNLIVNRLQLLGYSYDQAVKQYGEFSGMAMAFINISIALALSLGISLVPSVAESFAVNNIERIRHQVTQAIRLSIIFALPSAAGLCIFAHQLTLLVFADESAGVPLVALSTAVVFWSVHLITSGTLQGMGRAIIPARNLVIGILINLAFIYYLTPTPLGIRAAALGTVLIFVVSSLLNIFAVSHLISLNLNLGQILLRPGIATIIMSASVMVIYRLLMLEIGGNTWPTLLAVTAGLIIYPVVLVIVGGIRAEDVRHLPGVGEPVAAFLKKVGKV